MAARPPLDWQNDPRLKAKRRELGQLYKEHTAAQAAKDTKECGRLMTKIWAVYDELGIKSPREIGL